VRQLNAHWSLCHSPPPSLRSDTFAPLQISGAGSVPGSYMATRDGFIYFFSYCIIFSYCIVFSYCIIFSYCINFYLLYKFLSIVSIK